MAVGVWAWTEKNAFNNLSKLTHLALDPAFALILIGKLYIYYCICLLFSHTSCKTRTVMYLFDFTLQFNSTNDANKSKVI